jgi:hypothetical protein
VRATSLALLMRCMQLAWVLVGSIVAFFGPRPRRMRVDDVRAASRTDD